MSNLNILLPNSLVIHPFLFVLIPLGHLYLRVFAANLPFCDFALISLVVFSGTVILFYITKHFIGNKVKAGIITSLIIIPFLLYNYLLEEINGLSPIPIRGFYFFIAVSVAVFLVFLYTVITKRRFNKANLFLNIMAIVSLLTNLYEVGTNISHIKLLQTGLQASIKAGNSLLEASEDRASSTFPDIYYIITDAHTSSESLQRFWSYDESPFLNHLRDRGFYIASESHSNYGSTLFSPAATLNMEYVPMFSSTIKMHIDLQAWYSKELIKESSVIKLLAGKGYEIINLSMFDLGPIQRFYPSDMVWPDFKSVWSIFFERTMAFHVLKKIIYGFYSSQIKANNDRVIARLNKYHKRTRNKPVFVYAHLMMPHFPFICDANGNQWDSIEDNEGDMGRYLQYLIYTDKVLLQLVNTILSNSLRPPVIILQGDHGFRLCRGKDGELEAFTILNACYLPNGGDKLLYQSISPVNTFRVIFNKYLGKDLKLLDDRQLKIPKSHGGF